jgi:hypothetical protein
MLGVDLTKDSDAESRPFAAQWKPAVAIVLLVVAMKYFGGHELALPMWSGAAALVLTIATRWKLHRRTWFWGVMSVFIAAHVLAVMFAVRWQSWVSVKGFVLLAVLDWLVMMWVLNLVGKAMGKRLTCHRSHQPSKHAANGPNNPK